MKSCRTTKNPCKICFQSVNKRNGLQCHGACKKWVHFECLNFTPGKIRDIKNGFIKVMCPCPDCTSSEPKEILANPPFTCQNIRCPANSMPICESLKCPAGNPPKGCDKNECSKNVLYEGYNPSSMPMPKLMPTVNCPPQPPEGCHALRNAMKAKSSCCCASKGTNPPSAPSYGSTCITSNYTGGSSSDSRLYQSGNPGQAQNTSMECALEQMCNTVNVLARQIQQLLSKLGG